MLSEILCFQVLILIMFTHNYTVTTDTIFRLSEAILLSHLNVCICTSFCQFMIQCVRVTAYYTCILILDSASEGLPDIFIKIILFVDYHH